MFRFSAKTVLKIKLVYENAVTRAHGRCSLQVMGFSSHSSNTLDFRSLRLIKNLARGTKTSRDFFDARPPRDQKSSFCSLYSFSAVKLV